MSACVLHVHVRATVHVHYNVWPCRHAACPCPYCKSMSMQVVQVFTACQCLFYTSMSILHVHIYSMLNVPVRAAYPCKCASISPCCMSILCVMLHIYAPWPSCISMLHGQAAWPCCIPMMHTCAAYAKSLHCLSMLHTYAAFQCCCPCYMPNAHAITPTSVRN